LSYFATISGANLEGAQVDGLAFVPAISAQDYVRNLVPAIAALDGEPVYLCDDTTTGTSDDFIGSAQDQATEFGSLEDHPMVRLLALCEQKKAVLRIWYPHSSPTDFERAVSCRSALEAVSLMIEQGYAGHWYFRVAP